MIEATQCRFIALTFVAVLLAAKVPGRAAEAQTPVTRTRTEIEALIKEVGSKNSVTPRYPRTLDLNWPLKPVGKWNANRNMGQFIWDIVNPNPDRWKEGVKLVHQLMIRHKERQFYSPFTDTPSQIVAKQSVKGVDAVTGATMTSEAIINATAKALAGGMK